MIWFWRVSVTLPQHRAPETIAERNNEPDVSSGTRTTAGKFDRVPSSG